MNILQQNLYGVIQIRCSKFVSNTHWSIFPLFIFDPDKFEMKPKEKYQTQLEKICSLHIHINKKLSDGWLNDWHEHFDKGDIEGELYPD